MQLLARGDVCGLLLLAIIAIVFGGRLTEGHESLRRVGGLISGVVFITFLLASLKQRGVEPGEAALRAAVVAAIALGLSWIVLAVLGALYQAIPKVPVGVEEERPDQETREEQERSAAWQQQQQELQRTQAQQTRAEYEEDQRRRADARARAELCYRLHAFSLGDRLPPDFVTDYINRYMGDEHAPEAVEERALQLIEIVLQQIQKVEPPKKQTDLFALVAAFAEQRQRILGSNLDQETKDLLIIELDTRCDELMRRHVQEMQP